MCGIFVALCGCHLGTPGSAVESPISALTSNQPASTLNEIETADSSRIFSSLIRRGPDSQRLVTLDIGDSSRLMLYGAVLRMRGNLFTQPLEDDHGNFLLWNGEVFGGLHVTHGSNDGEAVLRCLGSATSTEEALDVFATIQGPYAFAFYWHDRKELWFGRDIFGRRSLTYFWNHVSGDLHLSSCAIDIPNQVDLADWKELAAAGIYRLCIHRLCSDLELYPWFTGHGSPKVDLPVTVNLALHLKGYNVLNKYVPIPSDIPTWIVTHDILEEISHWLDVEIDALMSVLKESVMRRVNNQAFYCSECTQIASCPNAHIAVMFSGGIDSMLLAHLVDQCVPQDEPIDLLNVAFENKGNPNFMVPDRKTGLAGLAELSPKRKWNFVEINVNKAELQVCREERIRHLIYPLETVLDDSIGCAIWFASRGVGNVKSASGDMIPYRSTARVVISGLGADEQLGGYSRHKVKYTTDGWEGLLQEVAKDVARISTRNLGRDDRVISDHGKEARFPFLDENVVSFLNNLPIHRKMNMDLSRGVGEKLLLRACAWKAGLKKCALLAKRAIQFGSRISKCEDNKMKGADICEKLIRSSFELGG